MLISEIQHPEYEVMIDDWTKFRLAFTGGSAFIDEYLKEFSSREDSTSFQTRRDITYCPAHAKSAVMEIKNSIYQRMVDIVRNNTDGTYDIAIKGLNGGVDLNGRSMNDFIGCIALPELLSQGKVGIFVDKPTQENAVTLRDTREISPYLYVFTAEQIRSWAYDTLGNLTSVLLKEDLNDIDEETGLVTGTVEGYRHLQQTDAGIVVTFYDEVGAEDPNRPQVTLEIKSIPFVILEISSSLMTDIADYQIAMLNMASSDVQFGCIANFPFYTEQYRPGIDLLSTMTSEPDGDGTAEETNVAKKAEISVGMTQGRRYPKGVDRPDFIHPSSEPLIASMAKQDVMKREIKLILNLTIANLDPKRESPESKEFDDRGLESGLSYIGRELATGETKIAEIWSLYEGGKSDVTISYPRNYSLKTEGERRNEAKEKSEIMSSIPSKTFQKEIAKDIAYTLIGHKVSFENMKKIDSEIETAELINVDPKQIIDDHEAGLVSTETASIVRGYNKGEAEQAKIDHAERLKRITEAQTPAVQGVTETPEEAKDKKKIEQQADTNDNPSKKTRGGGGEI